MLREAASRVGPLTLRLREGAHYFEEDPTHYGGLVNDTTPVQGFSGGSEYSVTPG